MSKEEMNQELSIDDLKDVAGGCASKQWRDPITEEVIITHVGVKDAGKGKRKKSRGGSENNGFTDKSTPIMD